MRKRASRIGNPKRVNYLSGDIREIPLVYHGEFIPGPTTRSGPSELPDLTEGEHKILETLRTAKVPLTAKEVAKNAHLHPDRVRQYLRPRSPLRATGLVDHSKRGYIACRV